MKQEIVTTADGSSTIFFPEWNEHYHSKHGAIQEAYHVFIKMGLSLFCSRELAILEIGFGTGLNALITLTEGKAKGLQITYEGVEAYPVSIQDAEKLNYPQQLQVSQDLFMELHLAPWDGNVRITDEFSLKKRKEYFNNITDISRFDLIYFDAFGARVQPDLWTLPIFQKMYAALKPDGVLVTYSAKGSVRRNLLEAGFAVERLPGPPGKREMLRAVKKVVTENIENF